MAESIILPPNSKAIFLGNGGYTIVDSADFEWLNQYHWHLTSKGYVARTEYLGKQENGKYKCRTIYMHLQILNDPTIEKGDHKNHNTIDNRRENLRACTHAENGRNRIKGNNPTSSQYKGVNWSKNDNKWRAEIRVNYKGIFLGHFESELHAAYAYNRAAIEHFGEFAHLNDIVTPHDFIEPLAKPEKTSQYKGVSWNKNARKWQSHMRQNGEVVYLGSFHAEDHAAHAYNLAAREYFGEDALLNDIIIPENFVPYKKHVKVGKYRGAVWNKRIGKWRAAIRVNGTSIWLGNFATEEEAAKVYNEAAIKYHGSKAKLNDLSSAIL